MAEELADQLTPEASGTVADAVVPAEPIAETEKRPTIREGLVKAVADFKKDEAKKDKTGRLHEPATGKFATKAVEETPAEIPKAEKDVQPEASKAVGPPPGWSAESKAYFNTLPADHPFRKDVSKREEEVSTGFKTKSEELKRYQDIEQVLAPVRSVFQQAGVQSDAEAIKRLVSWEARFRNPSTRVAAFRDLAQTYGIDPSTAQSSEPSAAQEIPAQLRPVIDQFGNVVQRLSTLEGDYQRSREDEISKQVAAFSKDKPHFEKVRAAMGHLMSPILGQNGQVVVPARATTLEDAYQQAIWADPEIKETLVKEQIEKATAELNKTHRSQNSRQAAISPGTRAPSGPVINGAAKVNPKTVRGALVESIKVLQEDRA